MRKIIYLFFGILTCLQGFGQTQAQLNNRYLEYYQNADKELNLVYKKVLKLYASDDEFIKNLKQAQRIWIQFRDAEVKVKFPDREAGYYGSIHSMCVHEYLSELTIERTKKLKIWLDGVEEGDGCSGSINKK